MDISRRHATTVTRTAVNHVSNFARDAVYQENADVVKGVRYVATLDARTTQICASLDGRVFEVGQGERPPLHMQCRSTTVPVLRSYKELGIDLLEAPAGTRASTSWWRRTPKETKRYYAGLSAAEKNAVRASLSGQVPASTTYGPWLKRQPRSFQDEVLGPAKADLFRRGHVPIRRFTDHVNRPLTVAELQRLERDIIARGRRKAG